MSFIQALILGIVQGVTEFLPVSSSGHLKLGQHLFGLTSLENYILFDLLCHLGTLLAVVLVFWKDICALFGSQRAWLLPIVCALLPLFPLALALKPLKELMSSPEYLGVFFLLTSLFLFSGERAKETSPANRERCSLLQAFSVGLAQALAVLPGVSRSGATISTARLLGWERQEAARFSFLISIPAILGGVGLETLQLLKGEASAVDVSLQAYFMGFFASFIFGYLSLRYLLHILRSGTLKVFAWYCLFLSILTTYSALT